MTDRWDGSSEEQERSLAPGEKTYRVEIRVHLLGYVLIPAANQKEASLEIRAIGAQGNSIEVHGLPQHEEPFLVDFSGAELSVVKGGTTLEE
jgi:hypothetical protein